MRPDRANVSSESAAGFDDTHAKPTIELHYILKIETAT